MMESAGTKPHVQSATQGPEELSALSSRGPTRLPSTFRSVQRGVGTQFIGVLRTLT